MMKAMLCCRFDTGFVPRPEYTAAIRRRAENHLNTFKQIDHLPFSRFSYAVNCARTVPNLPNTDPD